MDHRKGSRIKRSMPIELWSGGECIGHCRSQDIGEGGLCVTNITRDIPEGILLTVKTCLRSMPTAQRFERKALVVSHGENRLGLMWANDYAGFSDLLFNKAGSIAA